MKDGTSRAAGQRRQCSAPFTASATASGRRKLAGVKAQVYGPQGGVKQYAKCTLSEWTEYYLQVLVRPRSEARHLRQLQAVHGETHITLDRGIKMKELTPQDIEARQPNCRTTWRQRCGGLSHSASPCWQAVERGRWTRPRTRASSCQEEHQAAPGADHGGQSKLEQAIRGTGDMGTCCACIQGCRWEGMRPAVGGCGL